MKANFPTILGVGAVLILVVFASSMGIFGNDMFSRDITSQKTDGEILDEINSLAITYKTNDDQEKLDIQAVRMQEKITEIAKDSLGLNVHTSDVYQAYFPLVKYSETEIPKGEESSQICDVAKNIPLHLQNIDKTERFQLFAEKYSEYSIELFLQDERQSDSLFHYGLIAESEDGRTALTFFHADSCTNQISDSERYFISCHNDAKHQVFSTVNKDDVLASLNHPDFCTIPLDSWRQSVHEYNQKIKRQLEEHLPTIETSDKSYESVSAYESESNRLSMISDISSMYVMAVDDEQDIKEKVRKYNEMFGPLPEEFLQILGAKPYVNKITPTLDDFKNILSGPYDLDTIIFKFGEPHGVIGSGIHIYVYELNDSTEIWIGYVDDIWYVKHVDADRNLLEDLFVKNPEPLTPLENDFDIPDVTLFLEKYPQAEIIVDQVEYGIHKKHYMYADPITNDSVNLVVTKHIAAENMNSVLSCHLDQHQNKTYGMMGSESIIEYLQNHDCLSENNIGNLEPIIIRESFLDLGFGENEITVFITDMSNHSVVSMNLFAASQEWAIIPIDNLIEAHNRLPETSSNDRIMAGTIVSETVKAGTYVTKNNDKEFWYTIGGSKDQIITIELQDHEFARITFVSENSKKWIEQINDIVLSGN